MVSLLCESLEKGSTLKDRTNLNIYQIVELVDICLIRTTYFSYGGKYYKQQHGVAMGSPVSPIVVNLCMETFEQLALRTYLVKIRLLSLASIRGRYIRHLQPSGLQYQVHSGIMQGRQTRVLRLFDQRQ